MHIEVTKSADIFTLQHNWKGRYMLFDIKGEVIGNIETTLELDMLRNLLGKFSNKEILRVWKYKLL